MHYQLIPYAVALFVSALVALAIFLSVWHRRYVPGVRPVLAMMSVTIIWCISNALEMMALELPTKLFWANMQYIAYSIIPVAWLAMTLEYTGQAYRLDRRRLALLLIIPTLTIIFAFTNQWHGLIRQDVFLDTEGSFPVVGKTYGPWFYPHVIYAYSLMAIALFIHVKAMWPRPALYRWQTLTLMTGLVLPALVNMAFTFGISPLKYDISPLVVSIGGVFFTWGIRRFKLFDILPAAYHSALMSIGDGMIFFDEFDRVVEVNPAVKRVFGPSPELVGRSASEVFADLPELMVLIQTTESRSTELTVDSPDGLRYLEARSWPITNRYKRLQGRVLLLHDTTEAKLAQEEILRQQQVTAVLEERERLARDLHDNMGQVLSYIKCKPRL